MMVISSPAMAKRSPHRGHAAERARQDAAQWTIERERLQRRRQARPHRLFRRWRRRSSPAPAVPSSLGTGSSCSSRMSPTSSSADPRASPARRFPMLIENDSRMLALRSISNRARYTASSTARASPAVSTAGAFTARPQHVEYVHHSHDLIDGAAVYRRMTANPPAQWRVPSLAGVSPRRRRKSRSRRCWASA